MAGVNHLPRVESCEALPLDRSDTELLAELAEEHAQISARLRAVYNLGASTPAARKELRAVRDLLLAHLRREVPLFAFIQATATNDPALGTMLDDFERETALIAERLLDFFSRYDSEEVSTFHFARDFGALWALITSRMRREENRIFPLYQKLKGRRA